MVRKKTTVTSNPLTGEFSSQGITFTKEGNIKSVDTPEGQAFIEKARKIIPQPERLPPPAPSAPSAAGVQQSENVIETNLNQPTMDTLNQLEAEGGLVTEEFNRMAAGIDLGEKPFLDKIAELGLIPADFISKGISKATGIERAFNSPEELASTPEGKFTGILTSVVAGAIAGAYLTAGASIRTILALGGVGSGSFFGTRSMKSDKRQAMADTVIYVQGLPEQVRGGGMTPEKAYNELRLSAEATQTYLSQIKSLSKADVSYYLSEGVQDQTQVRNNLITMAGVAKEIAKAAQQRELSQQTLRNQQLINIKRQQQGQEAIKV